MFSSEASSRQPRRRPFKIKRDRLAGRSQRIKVRRASVPSHLFLLPIALRLSTAHTEYRKTPLHTHFIANPHIQIPQVSLSSISKCLKILSADKTIPPDHLES